MKLNPGPWLTGLMLMAAGGTCAAADVTITVNGRVVARPCTVSTASAVVDLGDLYTYNLAAAGAASAWKSTTLELRDCPAGTSRVTATFSGTADGTGYYANQGTAGNLRLEVQDDAGTELKNGVQKSVTVSGTTQSASIPLRVRAVAAGGGATQGSIQAVISVTYTYS